MRMKENFMGFSIFFNKKRKKVWIYKVLTHPHPQWNIKTNPPHPHDLLPYTYVTHDLHKTLRFQPMTKPSSLFCLPPPPHLQRPQWNLQRGLVARWDSRRKHSSKQALCRESTFSSKGPALALAKNSSKVIILSSAATSLHSFNHPKISCTTRLWALKKSKALIGTGIVVGVSIRWFGSWEWRTRWLRTGVVIEGHQQ